MPHESAPRISPTTGLMATVVCVVSDAAERLASLLEELADGLAALSDDFEIVVVDNASQDDSLLVLRELAEEGVVPNLQVYALTSRVNRDVAAWKGIERGLGDVFVVLDPLYDDLSLLPRLLADSTAGADVVFAVNRARASGSLLYRVARSTFEGVLRRVTGINLSRQAPAYRLINRRVVSFVSQNHDPAAAYRLLPALGGFVRAYVEYDFRPKEQGREPLFTSVDRGLQLIVAQSHAPLRVASALAFCGASFSLAYSCYVVVLGLLRDDLAPGWVSMSLVMSVMFFLMSVVLLVLGEYVISAATASRGGTQAHIGREFTSSRMLIRQRVNVEDSISAAPLLPPE